jgi:D-alanyl-D-alanine carboxypeptidase
VFIRSVALLGIIVAGAGCTADNAEPRASARERPDLQRTLRKLTREQRAGAVALVQTNEGIWQGASGYAEGKRPAKPGNRFGIASTTKTFVATVVLQLAGEGRLSLRNTVERHLPGRLRDGRRIIVRQLLNHTSGLWDFSSALTPRNAQPRLLFPPGTSRQYSNMNYVVLGLIVEQVTGRRLDRVVRDRIFRPLRLVNTSYGASALRPHPGGPPAWLGVPENSGAAVAGDRGIVSTAPDLARFFRALFGGELLRPDLLSEMTRTVAAPDAEPGFRAGLGLLRAGLSCGYAWGHGGDGPSYSNAVLAARDGTRIVVVAQNTSGWPSAKDTAEEMFCR